MLTDIHPKLPMRNKQKSRDFYIQKLGFKEIGNQDFEGYLMLKKDGIEIHFFEFHDLDPFTNYGQVYIRTNDIETLYNGFVKNHVEIHPNGHLQTKSWGQKEFSMLDPDNNLLTFGQAIY